MASAVDGSADHGQRRLARTDEAIAKIRGLIATGDLRPGMRLPPEKTLCGMLGLSRGSMREAVKALEVARVLHVRRGDGTYVTSLAPELLLDGIGFAVQLLQDRDLLDVMRVRRILESEATALAATADDKDLLVDLRGHLVRMQAATSDFEELVVHDAAFHDRVIAACGNPTLATLLAGLSNRTLRARIWRGIREDNAAELTIAQHTTIYGALADRDPDAARAASLVHVSTSERWLAQVLGEDSDQTTTGHERAALDPPLGEGTYELANWAQTVLSHATHSTGTPDAGTQQKRPPTRRRRTSTGDN